MVAVYDSPHSVPVTLSKQASGQSHHVHHSDQGSPHTIDDFPQLLEAQGVTCSMSRRAKCWDNAAMKCFFSYMKTERLSRKVYRTREEARSDVFDYIERFYTPVRKRSKPDFLSPVDFEQGLMG